MISVCDSDDPLRQGKKEKKKNSSWAEAGIDCIVSKS